MAGRNRADRPGCDSGPLRTPSLRRRSNPSAVPPLAALATVALIAAGCRASSAPIQTASSRATSAAAPSAQAPAHLVTVAIRSYAYTPATVTVSSGTRVPRVNHDLIARTVTANRAFATGSTDLGGSAPVTPSKPGTYHYVCTYYPFMHGTIIVKEPLPFISSLPLRLRGTPSAGPALALAVTEPASPSAS